MKRALLFLSLTICTAYINGMKRRYDGSIERSTKKPRTEDEIEQPIEKPSPLLSLPNELQSIIFEFMTTRITASKQKEAAQSIRTLFYVNKFYNVKINTPSFSDALIDIFSRRFSCAHETIARSLATRTALQRLDIQMPLKQLCLSTEKITPQLFNNVVDVKKVNLEFTYTHQSEQKTALMISIDYPNEMYDRLLENGAHINGCNAQGGSALSLAAKSEYAYKPYRRVHFYKLIQQPKTDLDHQNFSKKSPLYILLLSLKKYRFYVSGNDIAMVRTLLQAGADPELPDKKGITPLDLANRIYDLLIIQLLESAIYDKYAKQDLMALDTEIDL